VISVFALEVGESSIVAIHSVVNPDKLRHLGPVADLGSVPREGGQGSR
jgi:RNA polymerase sigma-70 factor, ECF subfamily